MAVIQQVLASLKSEPPPPSMVVSGAGTADANGTYTYTGQNSGKNYYNKSGTSPSVNSIVWETNIWLIRVPTTQLYSSSSNVATPDLATWSVLFGDSPAPTVAEE
jgi:hypothetical protein